MSINTNTIRISLSDHVMLANSFDGGEFERLFPNAVSVPTRRRNSQSWNMTTEDARKLLGYITGCPAYMGPQYADCDPRETHAVRRAAKTILQKVQREEDVSKGLFTPTPGTKFRYGKMFFLVAEKVENGQLICKGTDECAYQVFAVSEEDRRTMDMIDMVTPPTA